MKEEITDTSSNGRVEGKFRDLSERHPRNGALRRRPLVRQPVLRGYHGLSDLKKNDKLCAYDVNGRSVLLLFLRGATAEGATAGGGNEIPPHDASGQIHMAFEASHDALDDWDRHLTAKGVTILSRTEWMRGGRSLYFRDPDGHLIEIAASPGLWPGY